jgi:hypothetical protein
MSYEYDSGFLEFVDASAGRSARRVIELVAAKVFAAGGIATVIDVGCGRGVWAAEWRAPWRHAGARRGW